MPVDFSNTLVVGISSRALFDLERENEMFEREGEERYAAYQREHEEELLERGAGYHLVERILQLNSLTPGVQRAEVVVMSRNNADSGLRIFHSIRHYGLSITRAAFTSGTSLAPYLRAFDVDLFLSASEEDVQLAINSGIAAALIYRPPTEYDLRSDQLRIAFDGDAVLFSHESEKIFKEQGIDAFVEHEHRNARNALSEGPFAKLLKTLAILQKEIARDPSPIRTALITARNSPAHERVIRTLRAWDVRIDEVFFMGGVSKDNILQAFGAHIFFDDQDIHLKGASQVAPSARVLSPTDKEEVEDIAESMEPDDKGEDVSREGRPKETSAETNTAGTERRPRENGNGTGTGTGSAPEQNGLHLNRP